MCPMCGENFGYFSADLKHQDGPTIRVTTCLRCGAELSRETLSDDEQDPAPTT